MGLLRVLLALAVALQHFGQISPFIFIDAGVAVFAFFTMSGFYMALVLNTKYVGKGAVPIFYINRFARLWPCYVISLLLAILGLHQWGLLSGWIDKIEQLPAALQTLVIFSNISFVGLDLFWHISLTPSGISFSEGGCDPSHNGMQFVLNVPAWTIWIELLFYLAAPFLVRSLRRSLVFMLVGIAYAIMTRLAPGLGAGCIRWDLYYPYSFAFFGLGGVTYWLYRTQTFRNENQYLVAMTVAVATLAASLHLGSYLYLALALAIPKLFELTKHSRIDRFLGDLAYPFYILHLPIHSLAARFEILPSKALQSIIAVVVISVAVVLFIERPIDHYRERWTIARLRRIGAAGPS